MRRLSAIWGPMLCLPLMAAGDEAIQAMRLSEALSAFAKQSGLQVVYVTDVTDVTDGLQTKGAPAGLEPEKTLEALLDGTSLTWRFVNGKIVTIETQGKAVTGQEEFSSQRDGNEVRVGQAETAASAGSSDAQGNAELGQGAAGSTESPQGAKVEEIVVTAQKKVERLLDVPVPVTVVDSDVLVRTNQLRLQDYAARIPGLTVVPYAGGVAQAVVIRGLYSGASPTVAHVIDEVPFGWNNGSGGGQAVPDLDPGDVARLEVLRGPQGTLYGASSLGGLIKYVTVDPLTTGFSGRLSVGTTSVTHGDQLGYNVRGRLNVPLSDTLAMGLSGYSRREPGYLDRVLGDEGANEERAAGGRLSLVWRPAGDWAVKFNAFLQKKEVDGPSYAQPELGEFAQNSARGADAQDLRFQAYSATLTGQIGSVDLTSITGYNRQQYGYAQDIPGFRDFYGPPGALPFSVFQFNTFDLESTEFSVGSPIRPAC